MVKKIIGLAILVLILAGSGFFYWQNQQDVRELNKTLPKGVRVTKSIFGQEYKVVNKIDGYEFKVPKKWKGLKLIKYNPPKTEEGYTWASVLLGGPRVVIVDSYIIKESVDLQKWIDTIFKISGLNSEFKEDEIGKFEIIKTQIENKYMYFLKNNFTIYIINSSSEEFIREIILNGKW